MTRLFPGPGGERRSLSRPALVAIGAAATITLIRQAAALFPPEVYQKDFIQEYLLARAILDRANPYAPQTLLAVRYLPEFSVLPQVAPHPPFAAVASVPLGLVPYPVASAAWLGIELILLIALASLLLTGDRSRASAGVVALTCGVLLLWYPVFHELFFGQLTLLLAMLLVGSWLAHRANHARLAGILLGTAIALKLFPALIAGFFVLKQQWLTVLWAGATALALTAAAAFVIGTDALISHVTAGLPAATYWRAAEGNYSLLAAVWRIFAGSISVRPLIDLPALAWPMGMLAASGGLGLAARCILRSPQADTGFAAALCGGVLAGPTTWQYYLVLLVWPVVVLGRRLRARGWPPAATNLFLLAVLVMGIPLAVPLAIVGWLGGTALDDSAGQILPSYAGLPLLFLPIGPMILLWLLHREPQVRTGAVDQSEPISQSEPESAP